MLLKKLLLTKDSQPNYLFLFIALMLMITFPAFGLILKHTFWVFHMCYSIVVLTSMLYAFDKKKKISFNFVIGTLAFFSYWLSTFVENDFTDSLSLIVNFIFFIALLLQVILETLDEKNVTMNTLYAVSVGYFLLGLLGYWLLVWLDIMAPGSLSGNLSDYRNYDLVYFSFVTLTSVGYGDIIPKNPEGKAICLLIGIIGQLYVSFAIAMIVGKYLNKKMN